MNAPSQIMPKKMKQTTAHKYFGVSLYFLRKAIRDGKLSYTKLGNCIMIDSEEQQKLIDANTHRK